MRFPIKDDDNLHGTGVADNPREGSEASLAARRTIQSVAEIASLPPFYFL